MSAQHSTTVISTAPRERTEEAESTCLVTIHGPGIGRKIDLNGDELRIGRGPNNDLVVPMEEISRVHCRIFRRDGELLICDLGSTNGTYLNDAPAPAGAELPLQPGDLLNLGGVIFKVLDGNNVEAQYHEELYRTAIIDGLTQVHNRRYLTEFLEREMARAERYGRGVALILFDVDHFKRINDEYGHPVGDFVLRELAAAINELVRRECCFARYGGEEFAIVLPETDLERARLVAERIRGTVGAKEFNVEGRRLSVTVSAGVAVMNGNSIDGVAQFFHLADQKLYEAKHQGRNLVVA